MYFMLHVVLYMCLRGSAEAQITLQGRRLPMLPMPACKTTRCRVEIYSESMARGQEGQGRRGGPHQAGSASSGPVHQNDAS